MEQARIDMYMAHEKTELIDRIDQLESELVETHAHANKSAQAAQASIEQLVSMNRGQSRHNDRLRDLISNLCSTIQMFKNTLIEGDENDADFF